MNRNSIRVTVCELRNTPAGLDEDWSALVDHVRAESSDLVVLPEMAFHPWVAHTDRMDPAQWEASVASHDRWIARLGELGPARVVAGTRPVIRTGRRLNEGYIWDAANGYRGVHTKYYLPDEPGFWEATWYERGEKTFRAASAAGGTVGFLICTELWFTRHAREYMVQDADLLVCPRATPAASVDKWIAGGRAAAVVSGAFCLSANLGGECQGVAFGGAGWIIEPEEGAVLAVTTPKAPFATARVDLGRARAAKHTYPRYVRE